jgi:hypothetical protein
MAPVAPELAPLDRRVDHLVEYVINLESSLPANAWKDRESKPYVPSTYRVAVWTGSGESQAVPDLSKRLKQLLPTALVEHLDAQDWVHKPWQDSVDLTLADTRELAQAIANTGADVTDWSSPSWLEFALQVEEPVSTQLSIAFQPVLPDGKPALMTPG